MEKGIRLVIWGRNPVIEALRAGKDIEKIYIAHDARPPAELLKLAQQKGVKVQRVSRRRVEELAETKKTQGVVALISPVPYVSPEELFQQAVRENSFILVMDHITDPQNAGNLLRSCEVFGGAGVLLPRERASPINKTVVKASSGAVFHLRISKVSSLYKALKTFREMGGWIFSVERGGRDIREFEILLPCALIVGSEDRGVSRTLLEISDEILSIPMRGKVNSLNVSSAGAIAMWETVKRRI